MSALRELLAIFDIKVDDHELKEGHKNADGFKHKLEEVAKTVGEAFAVKEVYEFVESQIEAAAHVQDLADRLDVSATAISNWGFVAKGAGIDLDSAARSLGFLEKNLGDAATKGGASAAMFSQLGIHVRGAKGEALPLEDVLGNVADAIARLPDQNQRAAASMNLFGREGRTLVPILAKGRDGMKELLEEADELGNGLGDDFFKNAKKAREEGEKLGRSWQSLKDIATSALLPAVTWVVKELKEGSVWMLHHAKTTEVMEYAVLALAVVVGVALVDALTTAAVALWALLAPFIPIGIAVAALTWVFHDLYKLVTEGDSALGRFADRLGGVGTKGRLIAQLNDLWAGTKAGINKAAYALGYFLGVFVAFTNALTGAKASDSFFDSWGTKLTNLTGIVLNAASAFLALARAINAIPNGWQAVLKAVDKTLDPVFGNDVAFDAGQGTTDVTQHGVPQSFVDEWNKHHTGKESTLAGGNSGERYGPTTRSKRPNTESRPILGPNIGHVALPPHVGGGVVVHDNSRVSVVVHTKSDKPKEVGAAAGAGVASAVQKDRDNTLASLNRP